MSVYSVHDFYGALEVPRSASVDDVKRAYRRLALKYHPDKAEGDDSSMIFLNISHAYEVLSNPKVRAAYDRDEVEYARKIGSSQDQYNVAKAHALFHNFFGTKNPFAVIEDAVEHTFDRDAPPAPPSDVLVDLPCTLEELFAGCTKRMTVSIKRTSAAGDIQTQNRSINVIVERGWCDGYQLRYPREKDDVTGDIVFVVKQKQHPVLRREGNDLHMTAKVPLLQSLIGYTVDVKGPDGRQLHVRVDEIIHAQYTQMVKNEGMIVAGTTNTRGNLIVDFDIVFPTKLEHLQKELLKMALRFPTDMEDLQRRAISNALEGKVAPPKTDEDE